MNESTASTLKTGKYTVEIADAGCGIFKLDDQDEKVFVCGGISDPELAMMLIEGLILVENKRFYYPDSGPTVTTQSANSMGQFLKG